MTYEDRLVAAMEELLNQLSWHENTFDDPGLWTAAKKADDLLTEIFEAKKAREGWQ